MRTMIDAIAEAAGQIEDGFCDARFTLGSSPCSDVDNRAEYGVARLDDGGCVVRNRACDRHLTQYLDLVGGSTVVVAMPRIVKQYLDLVGGAV